MSTGIEWTDETWNPVTGCSHVSPGCDNCYAHTLAAGKLASVYSRRLPVFESDAANPFAVRLWPERLRQPESWKDPRMIFVNSMSDLFHVAVPDHFIAQCFEVMYRNERHTYQVLTKRPARAQRFFVTYAYMLGEIVPPHVWIGSSVENQETAYRVHQLAAIPASVRFLSCEPLLGPVTLDLDGIHWLIAGGESGQWRPKEGDKSWPVRPRVRCEVEWVRSLRDQCLAAGTAFFFKQWGGHTPKAGGRELDGRTWSEYPLRDAVK